MKRTLKLGLNAFLTCLILSSCSSCKNFDWTARPWVGDSTKSHLVNEEGQSIRCNEPEFDRIVCFDEANMAELVAEIARINKKAGKKASKELIKIKSIEKK